MSSGREDAVAMRQRHAEAARQKRMQVMSDADKNTKAASSAEDYKREKYAQLEREKAKKIEDMNRLGSEMSKMYNTGSGWTLMLLYYSHMGRLYYSQGKQASTGAFTARCRMLQEATRTACRLLYNGEWMLSLLHCYIHTRIICRK